MSSWIHEWMSGWGGPQTLELEAGDAIAGGENVFVGEDFSFAGGALEYLRHKPVVAKKQKPELLLLGPGDAIASGEEIAIEAGATVAVGVGEASAIAQSIDIEGAAWLELAEAIASATSNGIQIVGSAELLLGSAAAGSAHEAIEMVGEHRGIFIVAGDVIRITRPIAKLKLGKDGLLEAA